MSYDSQFKEDLYYHDDMTPPGYGFFMWLYTKLFSEDTIRGVLLSGQKKINFKEVYLHGCKRYLAKDSR